LMSLRGESRKATASATSAAVPTWPRGQARHLLADVGMRRSCASCQSVEMDPSATALVRIPFGVIANSAGALIGAGVVYVLTRPDTQQLQELDYAKVEP